MVRLPYLPLRRGQQCRHDGHEKRRQLWHFQDRAVPVQRVARRRRGPGMVGKRIWVRRCINRSPRRCSDPNHRPRMSRPSWIFCKKCEPPNPSPAGGHTFGGGAAGRADISRRKSRLFELPSGAANSRTTSCMTSASARPRTCTRRTIHPRCAASIGRCGCCITAAPRVWRKPSRTCMPPKTLPGRGSCPLMSWLI